MSARRRGGVAVRRARTDRGKLPDNRHVGGSPAAYSPLHTVHGSPRFCSGCASSAGSRIATWRSSIRDAEPHALAGRTFVQRRGRRRCQCCASRRKWRGTCESCSSIDVRPWHREGGQLSGAKYSESRSGISSALSLSPANSEQSPGSYARR